MRCQCRLVIRILPRNFQILILFCVCSRHSQTMNMAVIVIELQWHYDHVMDSLYMTGTCRFRLYFFFRRDFAVPLFHHLFDPTTTFLAIPLYMAHPVPPPASLPQIVPSLSSNGDPSEIADSSSSSSSILDDGYTPTDTDMANRFLSSESI